MNSLSLLIIVGGRRLKRNQMEEAKNVVVENVEGEGEKCLYCDKTFARKDNMYKHIRNVHDSTPELRKGKYECDDCKKTFIRKYDLYDHLRSIHGTEPDKTKKNHDCEWCKHSFEGYVKRKPMLIGEKEVVICNVCLGIYRNSIGAKTALCGICLRKFLSKKRRDKHMKCHTREKKHRCKRCNRDFANPQNCKIHERKCTQNAQEQPSSSTQQSTSNQIGGGVSSAIEIIDGSLELYQSAFNKTIQVFRLAFNSNVEYLLDRLQSALMKVLEFVKIEVLKRDSHKIYVTLQTQLCKSSNPDIVTEPPVSFATEPVAILLTTNLKDVIDVFYNDLIQQIDLFERNGSGWILKSLVCLDLNMAKYNPLNVNDEQSSDESDLDSDY